MSNILQLAAPRVGTSVLFISFELEELLLSELKLEPCQWEESATGAGAAPPELAGRWQEANCLVGVGGVNL